MYLRYMAIAFVTNGLGAFGLRILAGAGLGDVAETQYLALWYAAGLALAAAFYASRRERPSGSEAVVGTGMALCSLGGQLGMALALSGGIPGFIVFPVATGGGLLLVVSVGSVIFQEKMGAFGWAGIATGVAALILLALPG